jgi:phage gp36-like protein
MAYASIADMERTAGGASRITALSNPDGDTRDEARLNAALAEATSIVDSYIGQRYRVPLATVPTFLATYTAIIAVWTLANDALSITETEKERYKSTIDHLKRISDGKASLAEAELRGPVASGEVNEGVGVTTSGNTIGVVTRERHFGRGSEVAS